MIFLTFLLVDPCNIGTMRLASVECALVNLAHLFVTFSRPVGPTLDCVVNIDIYFYFQSQFKIVRTDHGIRGVLWRSPRSAHAVRPNASFF